MKKIVPENRTENIERMQAGRELNELVAERVMNLVRGDTSCGFMPWYEAGYRHKAGRGLSHVPDYSQSHDRAFEVMEKLSDCYFFTVRQVSHHINQVVLEEHDLGHMVAFVEDGPIPALICKAALMAIAGENNRT